MSSFNLAPLLFVLPGLGFLFNALFGRRLVERNRAAGERLTGWLASGLALATFVVAVSLGLSLAAGDLQTVEVPLFDWFRIPAADVEIPWTIQVDSLSVAMMLVVTGVGSLIHIYSIGYMHGDRDYSRFFCYLNLFLFLMLVLVAGNNYLMLFVGWEGVGLCSYLLVGYWFEKVNERGEWGNADAARKAMVVNRVGDFGVILALILMFWAFGSLEFESVFASAEELFREGAALRLFGRDFSVGAVLTAVTGLFLLGVAGKSAQIPLYVWLPDAMAGPTPVSALIHAATMVTAGIYLIVRSNVLFEIARSSGAVIPFIGVSSPDLVAYVGAFTALLAGLIAFTQFDIKKVLAYSTISQLGFMVAAAGMGAYVAAMFHLLTHAFFKALLFLGSGSVIHGMEHGHHEQHAGGHSGQEPAGSFDPQDMRTMGGLRGRMRTTFAVYLIGALALAGIPPLAGFWSKDEILAHAAGNGGLPFGLVYWLLTAAAICTAFYMGRQLKLVFFGEARHPAARQAAESPPLMTRPLIALALLTLAGGLLNLPYFSAAALEAAEASHDPGIQLALEHWLEPSLAAIELSAAGEAGEALLDLPPTPQTLQLGVALIATLSAVAALALAMRVVYRDRPRTAEERDPLQDTPIWWFAGLPLNSFYYRAIIPAFNRLAAWLALALDDRFWHDWFHDRVIRDGFLGLAGFLSGVLDVGLIDGLVNGAGRLAGWLGDLFRRSQTGYARNYALAVLLGVVALLGYFLYIAE
ncbi:MAG: NADH-quinone oxidoreductase subunit L [Candidatus Promineifilaceae bacterium]